MTVVGWALRCVALVAIITSSQLYLFPAPLADDNGPDTNSENSDTSSENTEAGDEGYVVIVRPGKKKKKHRCDDCSVSDIYLPDPVGTFM